LDKATVNNIAKLARIKVSESETESLADELTNIFDWIEQLSEVDTDNVEPMTSVTDMVMPARVDEVNDGADAERVLKNAPERPADGQGNTLNFFTVPKVIE
jgi:aspartyl-tRNA(Asn)/glutamyl-tRNA(Gln) amidotransferase subunit C